jgi:hypothetical protein
VIHNLPHDFYCALGSTVLILNLVVLVLACLRAIATHDASEEDGRVTSDTLHRLRNPRQ